MQRKYPELAAGLQQTPFPSKLKDLVKRYHSFQGQDGAQVRAVVLTNGRVFFTSTGGGREPPVIRPAQDPTQQASQVSQVSQDRVEARPRAEPAPVRPTPAAEQGPARLLIPR